MHRVIRVECVEVPVNFKVSREKEGRFVSPIVSQKTARDISLYIKHSTYFLENLPLNIENPLLNDSFMV